MMDEATIAEGVKVCAEPDRIMALYRAEATSALWYEWEAACKRREDWVVQHAAALLSLASEAVRMRKDAERYRWLRERGCGIEEIDTGQVFDNWLANELLDDAIDAARAAQMDAGDGDQMEKK